MDPNDDPNEICQSCGERPALVCGRCGLGCVDEERARIIKAAVEIVANKEGRMSIFEIEDIIRKLEAIE